MVLVRVLCWLDCWWCWCSRRCGVWWRPFWVRVGGGRGCGRSSVLGGFLCWFVVDGGVLGVVLGAGVAGVANGVSVGSGCFRW